MHEKAEAEVRGRGEFFCTNCTLKMNDAVRYCFNILLHTDSDKFSNVSSSFVDRKCQFPYIGNHISNICEF